MSELHERLAMLTRGPVAVAILVISRTVSTKLTKLTIAVQDGTHYRVMRRVLYMTIVWNVASSEWFTALLRGVSVISAVLTQVAHLDEGV